MLALAHEQTDGQAVDGKREMSIPIRHTPGEADDNDCKKDDKCDHDGLVVVDPREEAREEGGFCGRHG